MNIVQARICTEDKLVTVEKSLAIDYLLENQVHSTILPTLIDDCEFEILEVDPPAFRGD